ncbi:MAG TPA: tetraacyldisaccharide 4'-kinase [Myxococcales bacterium]|nr:tetraacyldisaccharide 4'-kinase [Myxococcales bacterium]
MPKAEREIGPEQSAAKEIKGGDQSPGWPSRSRSRWLLSQLRVAALRIASAFYAVVAFADRNINGWTAPGRGRLACAVVSVGGLTVGGAGKTPVAARLALGLRARGWRVVLASRGYKGRSRRMVTLVSDGSRLHSSVRLAGDESFILAAHAPGVPVLVGRDRRLVGHHAVSAFDAEILILDDGFQHHRLARDLDIVCIDGVSGFGNQRLLPAGPLRERPCALARADWLCVVDGGAIGSLISGDVLSGDLIAQNFSNESRKDPRPEIIRAHRRPVKLIALDRVETLPLEWLRNRSVGLISGVARPGSLRRTVETLGAKVVAERRFRDHHAYTESDLSDLDPEGLVWLTTEKDALKILPKWLGSPRLWVLEIEVEFNEEQKVLDRVEQELRIAGRLCR